MKRYHVVISDIAQESIEDHAELLGKIAIPAKRKFLRGVYAEIARLSRLPLSNPLANNQRLAPVASDAASIGRAGWCGASYSFTRKRTCW